MNQPTHAFSVDELGFLQMAPAEVLAAVARGELDLNHLAREELAQRGLGLQGQWIGFARARQLHRTRVTTAEGA